MSRLGPIFRKIAMRRSRAVLLLLIILITHLLVASHIQNTPIKQYIANNVPIPQLKHLLLATDREHNGNDFDTLVVNYMQQQQQLQQQLQGASLDSLDEKTKQQFKVTQQVFEATTYTNDALFYTINIPPKEQIPPLQPFDPRYTFGLLLRHINSKLNSQDALQQQLLGIPVFHWNDYLDMSAMEEYIFSLEKQDCSYFDRTGKNNQRNQREMLFKPEKYCVTDEDIDQILSTPEEQAKYTQDTLAGFRRIQEGRQSSLYTNTGFHIFAPTGRNKKSLRPILARSYLNDFMQLPLTLTFLLPGSKSIQVDITQQQQQQRMKLKDSDLFQQGVININDEITALAAKLPTRNKHPALQKELIHDQFVDTTTQIIKSLESTPKLNHTDKNYLHALKTSIQEHDPPKYFNEAYIVRREAHFAQGGHYDWRFFNGIVNDTPRQSISINAVLQAFLRLTTQYELTTWIAHGSLLSWYWNGLQFPWDSDVDVQMPIVDLHRLSQLFNQTIVVDLGSDLSKELRFGRFFLDSSTFISYRAKGNGRNNIDARFIDLDTGLYIDITGLAVSDMPTPPRYQFLISKDQKKELQSPLQKNEFLQIYNCRNAHFSKLQEISPLRLNLVQGEIGYIPNDFESMLHVEYKAKGTSSTLFAEHVYLPKLRIWVPKLSVLRYVTKGGKTDGEGRLQKISEGDTNLIVVNLTDDEYIEFLYLNEPVLRDFIATHKVTMAHNEELRNLIKRESSIKKFLKENADIYKFGSGHHDMDGGGGGGGSVIDDETLERKRASLQLDYFVDQVRNAQGGYDFNAEVMKVNGKVNEYANKLKSQRDPRDVGFVEKMKNGILKKSDKKEKQKDKKSSKKNEKKQKKEK